jgi:hypothetical protein
MVNRALLFTKTKFPEDHVEDVHNINPVTARFGELTRRPEVRRNEFLAPTIAPMLLRRTCFT